MFQKKPEWEQRLERFGKAFPRLQNAVPSIKKRLHNDRTGIITVSRKVAVAVLQTLWNHNFTAWVASVNDGKKQNMVKIHINRPRRSRGQKAREKIQKNRQQALNDLRVALQP